MIKHARVELILKCRNVWTVYMIIINNYNCTGKIFTVDQLGISRALWLVFTLPLLTWKENISHTIIIIIIISGSTLTKWSCNTSRFLLVHKSEFTAQNSNEWKHKVKVITIRNECASFTSHILSPSMNRLFHWVNFIRIWSDYWESLIELRKKKSVVFRRAPERYG